MTAGLLLLGSPAISRNDETLALANERRSQLLVYLAFKSGWVGRAELAALLWPEQEQQLAFTNLRKTLFRLRTMKWGDAVEQQGGALRCEIETDVSQFEAALRDQRTVDALDLRRGEFLAGFEEDDNEPWSSWLNFERDRLRSAWRTAAQSRLNSDIDPIEGIDLAARLLDADPLDEEALRAYMVWLARGGQSARARQAYVDFKERLAKDLGLDPGAESKVLHDSLGGAGLLVRAPAPLPAPDGGFVGRTVELRRIAELLSQADCRLLSLTGPGGMGKTRLAYRVIGELGAKFADGATFVPLEDITVAGELAARLARELNVALRGRAEPLSQVIESLRGRELLLVLDNFEQLSGAASLLQRLLEECPRLKILVTSRVRLALAAEWLVPLEGLPCPEDEDRDRVEAFDAAQLFVRAARKVQPSLVPAADAAAIVDICRQVEGLPLALELAAAWTRVLSCEAIAEELRQGAELLQATDAAHPPRHASIEVVFDQSWNLLSAVEREALARLSVFRGGFSAEAARAIAGAPLPVIGALVDKSLVRKDGSRLHLHPLVQQMAALRLDQGSASDATQAAHAKYFHRLLAQLTRAASDGERSALSTIDLEWENCRRAWSWSISHDEVDALKKSARTLLDFFDYRGRFEEGLALMRRGIESPAAQSDSALQGQLLSKAAHLEYRLDRYAEAEATALRALAADPRKRDSTTRHQAVSVLATCAFRLGRYEDARNYFKQALEFASPEGKAHLLAANLDHMALIEKHLGNYDEALRLSLQSLEEHRRIGDTAGLALCLNNLASLYVVRHEHEAAGQSAREALAICERDGIVSTRGFVHANLCDVALMSGDLAAAETHAERAIEIADSIGNRAVSSWAKIKSARTARRRGDLDAARSRLVDGLRVAIDIGLPSLKLDALDCFAEILSAQGEAQCARQLLTFGVNHPLTTAPTRDLLRERLEAVAETPAADLPWPKLELDELLGRVVSETGIAHAQLIATLRGAA